MAGEDAPIRGRLVWDRDHYEVVIERLRRARVSVWIATANLKDVHVALGRRRYVSILEELDVLVSRGVSLRILHAAAPSRPFRDAFDRFERLWKGGLELRQCPRVHLKTVIVDGEHAYVGSANFTGAGLGVKGEHRRNFELGLWTDDEGVIDAVQDRFERIWRGASCSGCGLRSSCEAPLDLAPPSAEGRTVLRLVPPPVRRA